MQNPMDDKLFVTSAKQVAIQLNYCIACHGMAYYEKSQDLHS